MKKVVRLTENDLIRLVKRVINEQGWWEETLSPITNNKNSNNTDPKRVKFFDNLTNQISSKLIGKTIKFGKIGVLDNCSIVIERYADRNHAVNLENYQVKNFSIMFYVRRVEEDLYKYEKSGTRIWKGLLEIEADYNISGGISNPIVTLYLDENGKTYFDRPIKPTENLTWDQLGGKDLWIKATNFNQYG
jgi:hypothetical protein